MAFNLLSEPIRKYIRSRGWESLRPIQAAAITKITSSKDNYILASRTASGKTEAAFLPILSITDFKKEGVQILYISPLIALINDQFFRIEELCRYLDLSVTKWHGEANKSAKNTLLKNPNGIVLITPESLEAMFVNKPYNVKSLFGNLSYIIIDEIHSFLGSDRGIQLTSLLYRIQEFNQHRIIKIGLSATIGDANFIEVKKLFGEPEITKVLLDNERKKTLAEFKYFENKGSELPLDLIKDIFKTTNNHKCLIFPNSRGRVEEIAVKLKKIAGLTNSSNKYYSHHSSIDKEIREDIELFAKNNIRYNFCITCTSTLELGIDIGSIDKVLQIDSTHSVASLVQRIGRSGRQSDQSSNVTIYSTDKWSFLQSLSCWSLYEKNVFEPIVVPEKPYDILFHQILSIAKQSGGISLNLLINKLKSNYSFINIDIQELTEIIEYAIDNDFLELLGHEIILGLSGEKLVNSKEFYSVFKTPINFAIINNNKKIGEIPFSNQIAIDSNILLAAKIWKIIDIDFPALKIIVTTASDGKKPIFFGNIGDTHCVVRKEMLKILKSNSTINNLDNLSQNTLLELRNEFKYFNINDFDKDRPTVYGDDKFIIYTFSGSKLNRSLDFLIKLSGTNSVLHDFNSTIEIETNHSNFNSLRAVINEEFLRIDYHLEEFVKANTGIIDFTKWGGYLPTKYQIKVLKDRYFDFENAIRFLNSLVLI